MGRSFLQKRYVVSLIVACTVFSVFAFAGVVGDNDYPGTDGNALCCGPAVGGLTAGAWDVISELRMLGAPRMEEPVIAIAQECVERSVLGAPLRPTGDILRSVGVSSEVEQALTRRSSGAFVTVVRNNAVRACVGSIWSQCANLADEIALSAAQVAARDWRRPPIEPWELPACEYAVSIVGRLERVSHGVDWDPRAYGVFVRAGQRAGVILPGEALTYAKQVSWARDEAGIGEDEPCEMYRFQTVKYGCSLDLRR